MFNNQQNNELPHAVQSLYIRSDGEAKQITDYFTHLQQRVEESKNSKAVIDSMIESCEDFKEVFENDEFFPHDWSGFFTTWDSLVNEFKNEPDNSWGESPMELVGNLFNERDELKQRVEELENLVKSYSKDRVKRERHIKLITDEANKFKQETIIKRKELISFQYQHCWRKWPDECNDLEREHKHLAYIDGSTHIAYLHDSDIWTIIEWGNCRSIVPSHVKPLTKPPAAEGE